MGVAQKVREVMTPNPITVHATDPAVEAARAREARSPHADFFFDPCARRFLVVFLALPPLLSTEAFNASMRSTTFGVSSACSSIVIVSPLDLRLMRSSTRLRYSSRYFAG